MLGGIDGKYWIRHCFGSDQKMEDEEEQFICSGSGYETLSEEKINNGYSCLVSRHRGNTKGY